MYYVCIRGAKNVGCQITMVTKYFMLVPNVCGFSGWNLLHVTLVAPRILRGLLDFWKGCASLVDMFCGV
jgi:hypothetical protein